jgi:hypothetical protein
MRDAPRDPVKPAVYGPGGREPEGPDPLHHVPAPIRAAAKGALRVFAMRTSALRDLPAFVIIGTKRGGTTSLYNYLRQHPLIEPLFPRQQRLKGVHYFDRNYERGDRWYRSHFPIRPQVPGRGAANRPIAGEASPYYMLHPRAAERAHLLLPRTRIIAFLRDPVERAFSHYRDEVRLGHEPLSFEDAIDAEPDRMRPELRRLAEDERYYSFVHEHLSYVGYGMYADLLPAWIQRFGRRSVYIGCSEDLFSDPGRCVADVVRFLDLPPHPFRTDRRHNVAPEADLPRGARDRLHEVFSSQAGSLEALGAAVADRWRW